MPKLQNLLEMMIDEAISSSEHKAVEFFDQQRGCWYLFSATPNPNLNHVAVLAIDITDMKKAQKTLSDKERLAGALEMAGAVAHQFSQPMQAIVLHCDLIAKNGQDCEYLA
jgi:C4-dicarboxylate-specific signal transduction histidine kinase